MPNFTDATVATTTPELMWFFCQLKIEKKMHQIFLTKCTFRRIVRYYTSITTADSVNSELRKSLTDVGFNSKIIVLMAGRQK